jgi:hypothetical protein
MQRSRPALALYERIEIAERDWLICGLLWIAIGTLMATPLGIVARAGRALFAFALCVHTTEAVYVAFRAWTAGLGARKWFLRTMVLGALALLTFEVHLHRAPRRRSVG